MLPGRPVYESALALCIKCLQCRVAGVGTNHNWSIWTIDGIINYGGSLADDRAKGIGLSIN